jgi:signal transduction histidine kinase
MTQGPSNVESLQAREPDHDGRLTTEDFLAMAVHELRSSAGVLIGSAQTLARLCEDAVLPTHAAELIDLIDRSGRNLSALIADLLTSAYLERGDIPITLERVALRAVLERSAALDAQDREGVRDGSEVVVVCDPQLEVIVDAGRLERIVANLVANGREHGRPPITVTATTSADEFQVAVDDHGEGLDPAAATHLFERFGRLAARRSTSTGLGLSIARGLARAMGGDLAYERLDPGSRFVVTLPHAPAADL